MEKDVIAFKVLILSLDDSELKKKDIQKFENATNFSCSKVKRFEILNIYQIRERIQIHNNQYEIANQIQNVIRNINNIDDEDIFIWMSPPFEEEEDINYYIFFTNIEITDCFGIIDFKTRR